MQPQVDTNELGVYDLAQKRESGICEGVGNETSSTNQPNEVHEESLPQLVLIWLMKQAIRSAVACDP